MPNTRTRQVYLRPQTSTSQKAHITNALLSIGYKQCKQDECLYTKHKNEHFSILSVHVDDILQVTSNRYLYEELRDELTKIYGEVTAHPEATTYLGIQRSKCHKYIRIAQDSLVSKVIAAYPPSNPAAMCTTPATN
jgi:hypothetical protein